MTLDEARGHVGDTLVHKFLDQPAEEAELVRVGNGGALHVRFAGSTEVVTMHSRHFTLKAGAGCRCGITPDAPSEVIPVACPVHGTPCEYCGGLESCKGDCNGG